MHARYRNGGSLELDLDNRRLLLADGTKTPPLPATSFAVVVVLAAHRADGRAGGLSPADISRHLRALVSAETVKRLLWEIRELAGFASLVAADGRRYSLSLVDGEVLEPPADALFLWVERHLRWRVPRGAYTADKGADLDKLHQLIRAGEFDQATLLLRQRDLRNAIGKHTSGKARQALMTRLDTLEGGMLVERGHFVAATTLLERARKRALSSGDVLAIANATGNLLVALRMTRASLASTAEAIGMDLLNRLQTHRAEIGDHAGRLGRWIRGLLTRSLLVAARPREALEMNLRSLGEGGGTALQLAVGEAETRCYRVNALLHSGDPDGAEAELERAIFALGTFDSERALLGWFPQYRARIHAARSDHHLAVPVLLDAWRRCDGYGFQRARIARLLLSLPPYADELPAAFAPSVAAFHRQYTRRWPRGCATCSGRRLTNALRCAVERTWPGAPETFLL